MASFKVLMTDSIFNDQMVEKNILKKIDAELVLAPDKCEKTLKALIKNADAVIVTYAEMTRDVIMAAEKCKVIARTGIGINNINIEAANEKGIIITNVPDYCIDEVADHTLALILTCIRKTAYMSDMVKKGNWNVNIAKPVPRLRGLNVGLFGFGNIARAVAKRLKSFGMNVMSFDPYISKIVFDNADVARKDSLEEILSCSDIVSLHAPLTESTKGIIDIQKLSLMKKTAYIINTSRGGLINQKDLEFAIEKGLIAGCGLDVTETEPVDPSSPLLSHDNVVITPHMAFYSDGSDIELREKASQQVVLALSGDHPQYWVNHK